MGTASLGCLRNCLTGEITSHLTVEGCYDTSQPQRETPEATITELVDDSDSMPPLQDYRDSPIEISSEEEPTHDVLTSDDDSICSESTCEPRSEASSGDTSDTMTEGYDTARG